MRKFAILLAGIALVVASCSDADPAAPVTSLAATSPPTTLAATSSTTSSTTTTSSTFVPSTTFLGPTVTYDPDVPRYGGAVVIADDQEPPTLNPYAPGGDNFIVWIIGQAHLAGVYDIDPNTLELIPELAVELPTVGNGGVVVNEDGSMDVTWRLHPEAQWSDGVPVSGADLAFTLDFHRTAQDTCTYAFDPPAVPSLEVIDVGDKNLTARFEVASLEHEQVLQWVVPAHAEETVDVCAEWTSPGRPTAGPFVFDEWVRDGSDRSIRLVRNDNYWKVDEAGDRLPYLDSVEFKFIPETDEIVDAFSLREVDVIQPPPAMDLLPIDQWTERGAAISIVQGPVWEHFNFQFGPNNRNEGSLNSVLEFRQAVAHGIDRRKLLDDAGAPWSEVSQGFVAHSTRTASSEPWQQYAYDPARSRELLASACAKVGRDCVADPPRIIFSTTSNADFRPAVADQLVEQLALVGIEVENQLEDSQLYFGDTLTEGSWDVGLWAWVGLPSAKELVHLMRVFAPDEPPPDGDNYYRWGAPGSVTAQDDAALQVQLLIDEMRQTADTDRVFALARQVEQILADQVVILPLNTRLVVGVVWPDEIQGFQMNPSQAGHTWNIENWYRVSD